MVHIKNLEIEIEIYEEDSYMPSYHNTYVSLDLCVEEIDGNSSLVLKNIHGKNSDILCHIPIKDIK